MASNAWYLMSQLEQLTGRNKVWLDRRADEMGVTPEYHRASTRKLVAHYPSSFLDRLLAEGHINSVSLVKCMLCKARRPIAKLSALSTDPTSGELIGACIDCPKGEPSTFERCDTNLPVGHFEKFVCDWCGNRKKACNFADIKDTAKVCLRCKEQIMTGG